MRMMIRWTVAFAVLALGAVLWYSVKELSGALPGQAQATGGAVPGPRFDTAPFINHVPAA